MYSTDDMALKWKDFEENLVASFAEMRKENDFTDVTLVCEDGLQIEAHRVVLCASSLFFKTILKMNSHSHPLVYMRQIKSSELIPLVEFLYKGEATVQPEDLDTFLKIAEELQLKGLADLKSNLTRESKTELSRKMLSKSDSLPLFGQKEAGPKKPLPAVSDVQPLPLLESMEEKIRSMMTVSGIFVVLAIFF